MTNIDLEVVPSEIEPYIKAFLGRFNNLTMKVTLSEVRFEVASFWTFFTSIDPSNEAVDGSIKINPLDEENTRLSLCFSRKRSFLFFFMLWLAIFVFVWGLRSIVARTRDLSDPTFLYVGLIGLLLVSILLEIVITYSTEKRMTKAFKRISLLERAPVVVSSEFMFFYFICMVLLRGFAFILGLTIFC